MEELNSVFKNTFSIRSKANFSALPRELVDKIVKKTDLPSRLALRKVSKYLRSSVDKQVPRYKSVGIIINSKCIKVDLEGVAINYTNVKYDKCLVGKPGRKPKKVDEDNMNAMFDDFLTFMSNPAFRLQRIGITFTDDASYEKFEKLREKRMPFQIAVDSLFFSCNPNQSMNPVMDMLDLYKLIKIETDCLEEESYNTLRHYKESYVHIGDLLVDGVEMYELVPKEAPVNQKERKTMKQRHGKPINLFKRNS
ncbi:hypothetical protein CAEBREN_26135 [Caenorhabditis brenneri]|uniref:F-box domain-containing protein n=1 Tax=Caenorhabditis brenneri TaxID=135651 RepID=G0NFV3_CAEBE|nr:hypothetical protein CAEBREN_26135 [Caenorhabditis brenneri]